MSVVYHMLIVWAYIVDVSRKNYVIASLHLQIKCYTLMMKNQLFYLYADGYSANSFDDYYNEPISSRDIELYDKYKVGNVTWLGEKGRMYKSTPDMTSPREDNIFSLDKLETVVAAIKNGRKIVTYAPIAHLLQIDSTLVKETTEAADKDRLWEYAITRPFKKRDIGKYWVKIRDGNHRAFGAFLAGAPYVWVYVQGTPYDEFSDGFLK